MADTLIRANLNRFPGYKKMEIMCQHFKIDVASTDIFYLLCHLDWGITVTHNSSRVISAICFV